MLGQQLETVHQYPYLGVELSEDLAWEPHINKVISKAFRSGSQTDEAYSRCERTRDMYVWALIS
jgi:hypothetical protein